MSRYGRLQGEPQDFCKRCALPYDPEQVCSESGFSLPCTPSLRCEVCCKEPALYVVSSGLAPLSYRTCPSCLQAGAEYYAALVFAVASGASDADVRPIVAATLDRRGTSRAVFDADVATLKRDFEEMEE